MKQCRKCLTNLSETAFNKQAKAKDGLHAWCRKCERSVKAQYYLDNKDKILHRIAVWEKANPEKVQAHKRAWRSRNAEKHRTSNLKWYHGNCSRVKDLRLRKAFGITLSQYNQMLASQQGKCAICGFIPVVTVKALAVDHSHETGKIRGLLCDKCNRGLGLFSDSATILQRAITYITTSGELTDDSKK